MTQLVYKEFGFNHSPEGEIDPDFIMKVRMTMPKKKGGLRQFTLIEPIDMFDYEDGTYRRIWVTETENAWNGSSAPIARQRAIFASLRHDIAYSYLQKEWARLQRSKLSGKAEIDHWHWFRKWADRQFACDMYYYDNQPLWRVRYQYRTLRLVGGIAARG